MHVIMAENQEVGSKQKQFTFPVVPDVPVDWTLCILCQKKLNQKLQCPANNLYQPNEGTYGSVARQLVEYHELGALPFDTNIAKLDKVMV